MPLQSAFNAASTPQNFELQGAVSEFYAQFPKAAAHVYFFDLAGFQLISDESKRLEAQDALNTGSMKQEIEKRADLQSSVCLHPAPGQSIVAIYPQNGMMPQAAPRVQALYAVFDHETAHAVIPMDEGKDTMLRETMADCYAAIRHFQRFGMQSTAFNKVPLLRAANAVLAGDEKHFTSYGVEKILQLRGSVDFTSLSTDETLALAINTAKETLPYNSLRQELRNNLFDPCTQDFKKSGTIGINTLTDQLLLTKNAEVFRWGKQVAEAIFSGGIKLNAPPDFSSPIWKQGRDCLALQEEAFAKETAQAKPSPRLESNAP